MPDGARMQERAGFQPDDIRIFDWTRTEQARTVETVVELRLQRGTAAAILLAATNNPTTDWQRQSVELMQKIGARLR